MRRCQLLVHNARTCLGGVKARELACLCPELRENRLGVVN
jgi:hypothetical protein